MLLVMGSFAPFPQQAEEKDAEDDLERRVQGPLPEARFILPNGTATIAPIGYAVNYNNRNVSGCALDIMLFLLFCSLRIA